MLADLPHFAGHHQLTAKLMHGSASSAAIRQARAVVASWVVDETRPQQHIDRWQALLRGSQSDIAAQLMALSESEANRLFLDSPFGARPRLYLAQHGKNIQPR